MRIMSNENIVSAHHVVWYSRNCSAMSQERGRAQFENFISEVAAATGSFEGHTKSPGTVSHRPFPQRRCCA